MINRDAIEALCLWASAIHNLAGRAAGHPLPKEALSERTASVNALHHRPGTRARTDPAVVHAIEAVERALAAPRAPRWFRTYLLFKYPLVGKYDPLRREATGFSRKFCASEAFVNAGHMKAVVGESPSRAIISSAVGLVEVVERRFIAQLQQLVRGE